MPRSSATVTSPSASRSLASTSPLRRSQAQVFHHLAAALTAELLAWLLLPCSPSDEEQRTYCVLPRPPHRCPISGATRLRAFRFSQRYSDSDAASVAGSLLYRDISIGYIPEGPSSGLSSFLLLFSSLWDRPTLWDSRVLLLLRRTFDFRQLDNFRKAMTSPSARLRLHSEARHE